MSCRRLSADLLEKFKFLGKTKHGSLLPTTCVLVELFAEVDDKDTDPDPPVPSMEASIGSSITKEPDSISSRSFPPPPPPFLVYFFILELKSNNKKKKINK